MRRSQALLFGEDTLKLEVLTTPIHRLPLEWEGSIFQRLVGRVEAWDTDAMHGFGRACAARADTLAGSLPALRAYADDTALFAQAGKPAVAGFVAARLAELAGGIERYESERDAQVRWLAEHLELAT